MERKTGLEPATPTLARLCSTTELLPHNATVELYHLEEICQALFCVFLEFFLGNRFHCLPSVFYLPSAVPPIEVKACVSYSVLCLVFCRSAPVSGLIVKNLFPYLSSQTLNLYQADRQNPSNEKGANISRQKCKPLASLSKLTSPSVSPNVSPSSSIRASATKALRCGPTRGGGESGSRRRCRAL